jgi:hypothetical protein
LPLPAGKLVRIARADVGRHLHQFEEALYFAVAIAATLHAAQLQCFPDNLSHIHARIKSAIRILKHDLHFAAQTAHLIFRQLKHITLAVEYSPLQSVR